jgi:uncharacterized protein involved in exopolysaccharide biosynthesis
MTRELERFAGETLDAPGLAGVLQIGWRRKSLVLLAVVVGLSLAGIYYARRPPVYQSLAKVLVIKKQADLLVSGTREFGYVDDYVATQVTLIRSPVIVQRAVQEGGLAQLPSLRGRGDPTAAVIKALTVKRDASGSAANGVIDLSFRGADPDDGPKVLGGIIDSYQRFLEEKYRRASDDTVKLIKEAKEILKKDLARLEEESRKLREKSPPVVKGKDGTSLHRERLSLIEARQSALVVRQAELRGRLGLIEDAARRGSDRTALAALVIQWSAD